MVHLCQDQASDIWLMLLQLILLFNIIVIKSNISDDDIQYNKQFSCFCEVQKRSTDMVAAAFPSLSISGIY